jgi:hypothetical protein
MKDWIPFLQAMVWPVFWAILLFFYRPHLAKLVQSVRERIEAGADFEAGIGGLKVGQAPKLADRATEKPLGSNPEVESELVDHPSSMYLVHTARRDVHSDKNGNAYFRVHIYLDADEAESLDDVEKVTYFLHETFKKPIRTETDLSTKFEVQTVVWGEFNVAARVVMKDGSAKNLERYINL